MSEDPYLIAEMAVPYIKGIQDNDVASCVKHFAVNSQETDRMRVNSVVDEESLKKIYYPGFKAAVEKASVYAVMGAYNKLNGEHCCTSKKLLNDVLRKEWGYDGVVVSDWGGVHDTSEAASSTLDIEMDVTYDFDNHYMANPLIKKIKSGEIDEKLVDDKVRNILRMMYRLKMLGDEKENRKSGIYNTMEHRCAALEVAEESLILLKNSKNHLPLDKKKCGKVAVIGANANTVHADGGGSAEIKALYEITPLMGIKKLLGGNALVSYAPGYYVPGKGARPEISWQADSTKTVDENGVQVSEIPYTERIKRGGKCLTEALELVKQSDTVIFVGGLNHDYDVEGLDRNDMKLPYEQDMVLQEILKIKPDTVVVMCAGSCVNMPWLDKVDSLLWSYYAGMEGGTAIAKVLFGEINPSGKLAETFIKDVTQCLARTFGENDNVVHKEGVMVGYRYYDMKAVDVNFCFGHGSSFSSFLYKGMALSVDKSTKTAKVYFSIKNDSQFAGKEVAQLYIKEQSALSYHELKGFEKVSLEPGETKTVEFEFELKASCVVEIGSSSRDIRLTKDILI